MQVIHAFDEPTVAGCTEHMKHWFGRTHLVDEFDDDLAHPVVCFCGARLEPLRYKDGEIDVAGVWHRQRYDWSVNSEEA